LGQGRGKGGSRDTLRAFWGPLRDDALFLEHAAPSRALSVSGIVKGGMAGKVIKNVINSVRCGGRVSFDGGHRVAALRVRVVGAV